MSEPYDPKVFWESRLRGSFNLKGTGHIGFSESYNRWLYRRKRQCLESSLRDTPLRDKDVLDIGCGTGFFVEWYLKRRANVVGIDITDVSIEKLTQRYSGKFFTQDIADPHYRPYREFDLVNMWDVIYHIVETDAFDQTLQNISISLKPGALLLITDWFGASSDLRLAEHVKVRCLDTYRRSLGRNFELKGLYPLYNVLNKPHWAKADNYLAWLYFALDTLSKKIPPNNLSLSVWRYHLPRS
jgi:SAM-dependent methyltransferase